MQKSWTTKLKSINQVRKKKRLHFLLETEHCFWMVLLLTFLKNTDYYTAPEIYKDEIFDKRVDVHSFGVILYEVLTHKAFAFSTVKFSVKLLPLLFLCEDDWGSFNFSS